MSDAQSPNGRTDVPIPEGGILASLPRERPQRASPRRTAARGKADKPAALASARKAGTTRTAAARTTRAEGTKPGPATGVLEKADREESRAPTPAPARAAGRAKAKRPKVTRTPPARKAELPSSKPAEPPAPKQGYEPEEELELGKTVNPPSGTELAESVADILSELASSGLSAGGRLLRDAFSVLRRP